MKTALIIEDNDDNMELITFILEKHGYRTLRAKTGRKGFKLALSEQPDFILLDIQLPDIEGTEVVQMIRAEEKEVAMPVIAVTSYAMAGDQEQLLAAGCTGYIEKPIDPYRIIDQIRRIIGEQV